MPRNNNSAATKTISGSNPALQSTPVRVTVAVAAPPGTAADGLPSLISPKGFLTIVECPVCIEVLLPPIYQCLTGHPICNLCRPKLEQCVLCKGKYTNSRNFPLEAIVEKSTFFCKYRDQGCEKSVVGLHVRAHFEECDFRSIKCPYGYSDGCKGSTVEFKIFSEHLLRVHKYPPPITPNGTNSFYFKFKYTNWATSRAYTCPIVGDYGSWLGRLIKFDGNIFVSRSCSIGSMFYFTLVLIGNETTASKYHFKFNLRNTDIKGRLADEKQNLQFQAVFPVGSIRDLKTGLQNKTELLTGKIQYCTVTKSVLSTFGREVSSLVNPMTKIFTWEVEYQIIKLS